MAEQTVIEVEARQSEHDRPHESGDDRYAIYAVTRRNSWRIAETSETGIGMTLRVLRSEEQITDDSRVGIFDRETRRWLINPWAKGGA